ncbi:hypothetical protein SCLCIDRAFT_494977 [Scleroderma citrinum Foug A]|uniref:Uncharacterized protein n=1 Tax=Scleroderma citrinum Foug A TaxID=1036808 RepID=A0A0C3AYA8_9AGAM|nr:hypothetical protein SCLCIDRAFT_494977 [Scleroderma citrinum Foug A]
MLSINMQSTLLDPQFPRLIQESKGISNTRPTAERARSSVVDFTREERRPAASSPTFRNGLKWSWMSTHAPRGEQLWLVQHRRQLCAGVTFFFFFFWTGDYCVATDQSS